MGFFDTVARLTITEAFKTGLAEINSRQNPDEMIVLLQQAEVAADKARGWELFARIDRDGANGYQKFLKFFQSRLVLNELQRPFQNHGKPDVKILVEVFKQSASEHPESENYLSDLMPLWMDAFVESYFERIGICFQVAKTQYLQQLARRVDDVKFVGIAVPGEEVEKQEVLAQIFVMPDVREERSRSSRHSPVFDIDTQPPLTAHKLLLYNLSRQEQQNKLLEEQKAWAMRDRSAPRIPAQKVINLAQKKAVVLGAPGSGKTMLASYFALMLCETAQSDPTQIGLEKDADYLPLVVRIRDWISEKNMSLLEYLRWDAKKNSHTKELPTGFFEHWLERGKALILLDGLDEVVDEAQRRKVAEQIETFLHQYQDNPAVITSRPAGYRWDFFNLDEFPHYTLESFDDKQVATFIDHWYDSRLKEDPAQADRRKADLQKAFARNERIRLLAKNPLLLTIITLIHRYQAELPRQRCKLYEKAVETLLTSWDSGKEIKLYSQVLLFLKSDDLLYILKKLAYWIHTQGSTGETEGGTLIDKDELIRWLRKEIQTLKKCEAHEAKGEAERFIDFIQRRTGLLNEQGRDRYAFVHKTFQEYLTAEEIFDRADVADDTEIILAHFRQHLHDQHWREVLLLLVSKLKGKKAQKAIQAVLDAGSEYEQWLHRDLLFAGWCLTEDPPELSVVAADLVGEILDRLVGLEVADSEQIGRKTKKEVEKVLHCFGETSLEEELRAKLESLEDRIDCVVFLSLQASLGQETKVVTRLIPLLNNKDLGVGIRALSVLGDLGNTNPLVVYELISLLHQNSWLKPDIISTLGDLGNTDSAVISILLPYLDDRDLMISHRAAESLHKLENFSEKATEIISIMSQIDEQTISEYIPPVSVIDSITTEKELQKIVNKCLVSLGDEDIEIQIQSMALLSELAHSDTKFVNKSLFELSDENMNRLLSWLSPYSDVSGSDSILIRLAKDSDAIIPRVLQWLEQNPNDDGIGGAIDCLWSIVVE
jgi:NACHT domain